MSKLEYLSSYRIAGYLKVDVFLKANLFSIPNRLVFRRVANPNNNAFILSH